VRTSALVVGSLAAVLCVMSMASGCSAIVSPEAGDTVTLRNQAHVTVPKGWDAWDSASLLGTVMGSATRGPDSRPASMPPDPVQVLSLSRTIGEYDMDFVTLDVLASEADLQQSVAFRDRMRARAGVQDTSTPAPFTISLDADTKAVATVKRASKSTTPTPDGEEDRPDIEFDVVVHKVGCAPVDLHGGLDRDSPAIAGASSDADAVTTLLRYLNFSF
jgi:hypothetical protein